MSNEIITFNFNNNAVRTKTIDGNAWFCLADCAKALGIRNAATSVKMSEAGVGKTYISHESGKKQITIINEPNLYRLIFRSNKPQAQAFADWVYDEVLPSIRRTGSYSADADFALPKHLTFKTGSFSDSTIRAFYDRYVVPEGGLMPCSEVYDCFISWCARNNKFPVSKNRFGRYLHARGVQNGVMPTGGKAYFLTLRNDEDRPVAESPKPLPAPDPEPELDFDANPVAKKARFNSPARSSYGRWAYKFSPVLTFSGTGIYRMYNGDLFAVVECVNGDLNMVSFNPFLNRSEGKPTRAPAASFNDAVREKMCSRTELM